MKNPGVFLLILRDAISSMIASGQLNQTTGAISPGTSTAIIIANLISDATAVNAIVTKYGVTEPAEVQKIITLLSAVAPLIEGLA